MKILFVVGGSYKNFYINHLKKYKNLDLLIFQQGLLYDYDYCDEMLGEKIVTNEVLNLVDILHCKVIGKVNTNLLGNKKEEILYADENGVKIIDIRNQLFLKIKNKNIEISLNKTPKIYSDLVIKIIHNKNECLYQRFSKNKKYLICDKRGVLFVNKNKKIKKFRKICYFTLKF